MYEKFSQSLFRHLECVPETRFRVWGSPNASSRVKSASVAVREAVDVTKESAFTFRANNRTKPSVVVLHLFRFCATLEGLRALETDAFDRSISLAISARDSPSPLKPSLSLSAARTRAMWTLVEIAETDSGRFRRFS